MNRKTRFVIAVIVSIVVVLAAGGAWAAPRFRGTVPPVPLQIPPLVSQSATDCLETVDMETAIFVRIPEGCIIVVELISDPAALYVPAPDGKVFAGDTFRVTTNPVDVIVRACYAYPPKFADIGAKIFKLNEEADPKQWVEIPGSVIENGKICVESVAGVFSLIGNQ